MLRSRAYYSASLVQFRADSDADIVSSLTTNSEFAIEPTQRDAWLKQIEVLRNALGPLSLNDGLVAFEFSVPRVGKRIDVLLVLGHIVVVVEFKVGEEEFTASATDQVWDYALDLKNFHSTSHDKVVVPILVATRAASQLDRFQVQMDHDAIVRPICSSPGDLGEVLACLLKGQAGPLIDYARWQQGGYLPTPTIIEAAKALYGGHGVAEISRSDASSRNLAQTSAAVDMIIREAQRLSQKAVCFVTGVPGAGKTLVGLNVATQHIDRKSSLYSVFLSGNAPLVAVLCEALARDKFHRDKASGQSVKLSTIRSEVKAFVQNVHHFRDECIRDTSPPPEHVAIFDEAQRAWNLDQTRRFMSRRKRIADFGMSEPHFLISCLDRHQDWAVVICLVGGGQEINTGEAGIGEWICAIRDSFPHWHVYLSPHLRDSEYSLGIALQALLNHPHVTTDSALHLSTSMRSFRAEHVSTWVKAVLDVDCGATADSWAHIRDRYPVVVTRCMHAARGWLRSRARGSERYGLVASSQAQRLKPHAIDVRVDVDPIHYFLHSKNDVRSSYYLEDAATEFQVQGLELDWVGVVWDGDFRFVQSGWAHWSFRGQRWERIRSTERQAYLKNAYRVLLTRARQGMVIVVPDGAIDDPTRAPEYYDGTFKYLCDIGVPVI